MATMNISVPDLMRDFVQRRIDSGRYASVSDYVRDLIRKDQGALLERDLSVEDIRLSIAESRAEGGTTPAEQVFERIEAKLKAMADQA
jgi:antitoxin ParD1/3/4